MLLTHVQGIAEHGIIESIEMHQFMCHKYLTFIFGPQINFIIGASFPKRTYIIRLTLLRRPQWRYVLPYDCSLPLNRVAGGKSAVLSAITVALGGKANSTGRASGLKSFIREGQSYVILWIFRSSLTFCRSVAEVTIQIKNQGEEAYKPNEYGKSIVITRKFTKDGSSSWKIKSKDGKVISTKKEDLAAICDHMNIQVDNPMNVLTQGECLSANPLSHS